MPHDIRVFYLNSNPDGDALTEDRVKSLAQIKHIPTSYEPFAHPWWAPAYRMGYRTVMGISSNRDSLGVVYLIKKAQDIEVTTELVSSLYRAQALHTSEMLFDSLFHGYSDDGYDYLNGALTLCQWLLEIDYEKATHKLANLLNSVEGDDLGSLKDIACDGICPAIYDLNCIALEEED